MHQRVFYGGIGSFGIWELLLILVIVLVIFGANRLPKFASSLGEAMNHFKKTLTTGKNQEPSAKASDDENKT